MKVLLDECVPFKLKAYLTGHHVFSVQMMGWDGVKNGDLIKLADSKFDVFVTIDKNLRYQQNLSRSRMAIILVSVRDNRVQTIISKAPELLIALNSVQSSQYIEV